MDSNPLLETHPVVVLPEAMLALYASEKQTWKHGKSGDHGDLGDPGSWKVLQIVEDLNKMTNNFCIKASPRSKSCPNKSIKGSTAIQMAFEIKIMYMLQLLSLF